MMDEIEISVQPTWLYWWFEHDYIQHIYDLICNYNQLGMGMFTILSVIIMGLEWAWQSGTD